MKPAPFIGCLALFAAAAALCFIADGYQLFVIATVGLTAIVGLGLNVLLGLAGQVSLGHVGFYAIGAYTIAILTTKAGLSFWIALPIAGVLSAVVGTILAIPSLRVRGPYLAMITIAFGFIIEHGAVEWRNLTGGANGILNIPDPSLFGLKLDDRPLAILIVAVTAAACSPAAPGVRPCAPRGTPRPPRNRSASTSSPSAPPPSPSRPPPPVLPAPSRPR
jgi:ABC-type branched-subunit amino acid transport system permease subunit